MEAMEFGHLIHLELGQVQRDVIKLGYLHSACIRKLVRLSERAPRLGCGYAQDL